MNDAKLSTAAGKANQDLWVVSKPEPAKRFQKFCLEKTSYFLMKIIQIYALLVKNSLKSTQICINAVSQQNMLHLKASLARKWGFSTEVFKHC